MRKFAAIFLPLALLAASPTTTAAPVGATPGSHQVSPSGAFTYTIPIAVPPGTGGIEPKLSLGYNSQGGNGLMGMGWSMSGLSVIHRCPKTVAQDGVLHGVNYDANDRYCLDGQRLVAISGSYGADATEYRTESESYSRIVSYGSQGTGPSYWKIWTKSGQILEFGNTDDSKIEAQGKTEVMVWSLNKLSDTVSNYLTVTYIEDNANGQYYPDRIDYTGNATTGKSPINSVRFVYETRPDITPAYHAGSLNRTTVRMTNVQAYAGTTLARDYRLAYEQSTSTQRSWLSNIQECTGDGACLPSTALIEQTVSVGFYGLGTSYQTAHGGGVAHNVTADFNGDGKSDLAGYTGSNSIWHVCLSAGTGFSCSYQTAHGGGVAHNVTADFNGDGKSDLAGYTGSNSIWHVCLSAGTGFSCSYQTAHGGGVAHNVTADFNGDGKSDLAGYTGSNSIWHVCLSAGTGFSCSYQTAHGGGVAHNVTADFNGDGKSDLAGYTGSNSIWHVCLSAGTGFSCSYQTAHGGGVAHNVTADFNGDGKSDLAGYTGSNSIWHVCLSAGTGFSCSYQTAHGGGVAHNVTADFNGDGKSDLAGYTGSNSIWHVCLSAGTGFSCSYQTAHGGGVAHNVTADFNGDGKSDLAGYTGSNSIWHVTIANVGQDVITTLTTGLNAATTITYKPLTDNTVYTKDATAVYPVVDIQAPMYVVSSVATSDGIGGNHFTDYTYAGAKSHQLGGGFLGFRQATVRDRQTGIRSVTNYRQTYPYHGAPLSTERRTSNNTLIDQSLITYTDQLLNTGISPTWHQSLPTHTVESGYELNGSLISTAITDTVYDNYGNPTSIVVNSGGGYSKTTTNTYDNIVDPDRWFLGRLRRSTVKSVTP